MRSISGGHKPLQVTMIRKFSIFAFPVMAVIGCILAVNSSRAATSPIELTSLTVQKAAASVRIEIAGNQSLSSVTIEESTSGGEAVFRIQGVRSNLKPIYEVNDRLVRSVRT